MGDGEFQDSSSDEECSGGRATRPVKRNMTASKQSTPRQETSFDHKWKGVMTNKETLPEFTQEEVLRGFGVMMARLSHLEEAQRRDRTRILFLETERKALKESMFKLDSGVQESFSGCAQLPGAPRYESVMDGADADPREMTVHELKCVEIQLRRLRPGGKRAEECSKIMASAADANGLVTWDITALCSRKQWQLFYYLFFGRVEVNPSHSERTDAHARALEITRSVRSIEISSELHKKGTEDDSSDCEYDCEYYAQSDA